MYGVLISWVRFHLLFKINSSLSLLIMFLNGWKPFPYQPLMQEWWWNF